MREGAGWASGLAKKAGLQPTAISHFETGTRSPSFDNLQTLGHVDGFKISSWDGLTKEMMGPDSDSLFRDIEKLSEKISKRCE